MPLEGQWSRAQTPLRRLAPRERNAAIALVGVTVVAILALVVATLQDSRPSPAPGCIYAIVPGFTGAAPVDACGPRARRICAAHTGETDPGSQAIEDDCRRVGIP